MACLAFPCLMVVLAMSLSAGAGMVVMVSLLLTSTLFQGAAQAFLRSSSGDRWIALSDILAGGAALGALGFLVICGSSDPATIVFAWAFSAAVRPLALLLAAGAAAGVCAPPRSPSWIVVARFLIAGQPLNVVKGALLPLEIVLYGSVASRESLASYRLARTILGFAAPLINIPYQKAYAALAGGCDDVSGLRRLDRYALGIWMVTVVAAVAIALFFAQVAADGAYGDLWLAVVLLAVALTPGITQQSLFARLMVRGQQSVLLIGYIASLLPLTIVSLLFPMPMSLALLSGLLLVGNGLRLVILWHAAARTEEKMS
jgi:hypothetical protein